MARATLFGDPEVLGGVVSSFGLNDVSDLSIEFLWDGLFSGKDPDELVLLGSEEFIAAGVNDGEVLIISVEDLVVSSNEGNEVDLALGSGSFAYGLSILRADYAHWLVEFGVDDSNGVVTVKSIVSLVAVKEFVVEINVSGLFEPCANVLGDIEVLLDLNILAVAIWFGGIYGSEEGKGKSAELKNFLKHLI